jgi:hypothetical protein
MKMHTRSHPNTHHIFQEDKMKTRTQSHRTLFVSFTLMVLGMVLLFSTSINPPRAEAQKPSATATPRVVKPQPTPAPQAKKPADVHIPHHRPGHLAKTRNLNDLVAGGQNDPLAGNYDLVNWERITTFWSDNNNQVNTKIYAEGEGETLSNPAPKAKDTQQNPQSIAKDVVTGHFKGITQPPQTVGASLGTDNFIWIHAGTVSSDLSSFQGGSVEHYKTRFQSQKAVAVAGGDFDGNGTERLALGFQFANQIWLSNYDVQGNNSNGMTPVGQTGQNLDNDQLVIATGDFNHDGKAEAAVAWDDGEHINIKIVIMGSAAPSLTSANKVQDGGMRTLSLSAGDVDGDANDEIIFVYGVDDARCVVFVYKVQQNFAGLDVVDWSYDTTGWQPTGAVGDFDLDGVDEIVVSAQTTHSNQIYLYVLALEYDPTNKKWHLTQKANLFTGSYVSNHPRLAVGDVNRDVKAEIVSTFTTGSEHTNNIQVFAVNVLSSGAWSITSKGLYKDNNEHMTNDGNASVFVALGNLDQKQLRVGAPTYTLASNFLSTLAVIGMPPKHKDTVGGKTYNINPDTCPIPPCTYVKYETEQRTTTTMSTTAKHAWEVSADFSYKFSLIVKGSIKATYGGEFEKTTIKFSSTTFGTSVEADSDDAVVYSVQNLDVWEYPVLSDGSDVPQGYIVIMFPQKKDPNCITNCAGANIGYYTGSQVTSPYPPNHEPFDVLSYSMVPPDNISVTIKSGDQHHWSSNSWETWVNWSDVSSDETKKTEHAGVGVEASIGEKGAPGHLDLKSSYDWTHVSTNETSFEQDTSIHLYALGIDSQYGYMVEPFVYWSKHGTLMLDYQVSPEADWWNTTYNHPDPAFNLPWADGKQGSAYKLMTREITFDPPSPKAGQSVTITAKIRNYSPSPVAAQNVKVNFYNGAPGASNKIGQTHTIAQLNRMSYAIVQEHFNTSGLDNQTLSIYAQIEPYTNEIHSDNNEAYAQLPVKPHTSRSSPATLSIASGEIAFPPTPVMLGVPTHISATVRAGGDTFTNIALEFWDGEPYCDGSTIIGGRIIPMVLRDEAVTEGIPWIPRGATGQRRIWVVIRGSESEDAYSDNRAYKTLNVGGFALFFPLIFK